MVHEITELFNCDLLYHIQVTDQDVGSPSNVKTIEHYMVIFEYITRDSTTYPHIDPYFFDNCWSYHKKFYMYIIMQTYIIIIIVI